MARQTLLEAFVLCIAGEPGDLVCQHPRLATVMDQFSWCGANVASLTASPKGQLLFVSLCFLQCLVWQQLDGACRLPKRLIACFAGRARVVQQHQRQHR